MAVQRRRTSESLCAVSLRSTSFSRLRLLNSSLNPLSKSSLIFSVSLCRRPWCCVCGNGGRSTWGREGRGSAMRVGGLSYQTEGRMKVCWFSLRDNPVPLGRRFVKLFPAVQKRSHDVLPSDAVAGSDGRIPAASMQLLVPVYGTDAAEKPCSKYERHPGLRRC